MEKNKTFRIARGGMSHENGKPVAPSTIGLL
jgi:hypothetical protein